ncbi:Hsp70 family protein [Nocardia sp. alder85J]|uniref:Hsp70 family protein n=1 Tax=Nocardia sp. alder85J TaxID=2862949 RepID=UPI001CD2E2AB|nr:Hsp70 family protein [Nocardia sp. alder85J]MCX4097184.1 Hsp70 family protein [Nocardia sp. alder85J]
MRTSLGISAGNEVVCSALVATAPHGAQSFDYRVVSADMAHSDLGDLVASSIELMTTQLPRDFPYPVHAAGLGSAPMEQPEPPGAIAVAYRDREQQVVIRSAIGRQRRDVQLIPESSAALAYLRHTGLLDRYQTVAVIDLGATGMTITVADLIDDQVLRTERSTTISGNAVDELIYQHLLDCHFLRRGTRPNRGMLINRSRAAKEHLSIAPAVTIDHVAGQPLKLTRADFEELVSDLLREAAGFAGGVFSRAPKWPESVIVIGGGANIPALVSGLNRLLDVPVSTLPEPEAVIAKGAALVADAMQPSHSATGAGSDAPAATFTKLIGTLAGAVVVVGLVVGYGVKELVPANHDVTPANTSNTAQLTASTAPGATATTIGQTRDPDRRTGTAVPAAPNNNQLPTTYAGQQTSGNIPPLRPDPNLPPIPLPDLPRLLGPLLGGTVEPSRSRLLPPAEPTVAPEPETDPEHASMPLRTRPGTAGIGLLLHGHA